MLITVLHERNHSLLIFITGPSMEKKTPHQNQNKKPKTPKPKNKHTRTPQNAK